MHDLVYTPVDLALDIISHFQPTGKVLDPCKGTGAFYDNFPAHCEKFWCEIDQGVDFFSFNEKVQWCVSNPPWSKMRQFLEHSYEIADNIVFLVTINHIVTKARLRKMNEKGFGIKEFYGVKTPGKPWPASGFQLAACHLQRNWTGPCSFTGVFGV